MSVRFIAPSNGYGIFPITIICHSRSCYTYLFIVVHRIIPHLRRLSTVNDNDMKYRR